ncbi:hypothetical protein X447_02246, partial [Mycobacterium tuberculosis XTB13-250]
VLKSYSPRYSAEDIVCISHLRVGEIGMISPPATGGRMNRPGESGDSLI